VLEEGKSVAEVARDLLRHRADVLGAFLRAVFALPEC
jgi:hypothetical protein